MFFNRGDEVRPLFIPEVAAEGRTWLQRFVYKIAEVEIPEGAISPCNVVSRITPSTDNNGCWEARDSGGVIADKVPDYGQHGKFNVGVRGTSLASSLVGLAITIIDVIEKVEQLFGGRPPRGLTAVQHCGSFKKGEVPTSRIEDSSCLCVGPSMPTQICRTISVQPSDVVSRQIHRRRE